MNESPWKKHHSKEVYDNAWITVIEDQVTTPTGTPGIYGRVLMKNKAIGILPIDGDGNTWLVGQYRYPTENYSWEIPMGGGLCDEDLLHGAKRELLEECGIVAEKWELLQDEPIHLSNSVTNEEGWIFVATELDHQAAMPDETEVLQVKKLPLVEAVSYAKSGKITDALSVIALLRIEDFLSSKHS